MVSLLRRKGLGLPHPFHVLDQPISTRCTSIFILRTPPLPYATHLPYLPPYVMLCFFLSFLCAPLLLSLHLPYTLYTPKFTNSNTHLCFTPILGLFYNLLVAPPPLINTPHLLYVPLTNYSCTHILFFTFIHLK